MSLFDYAIPQAAVTGLSQFCRVAPEKIRALDLCERASHLSPALLLRYPQDLSLLWCPRCSVRRVRYAFCPLCLARQPVTYARWEWSVACLIRCAIHRTPLLDGCPACGEPDPLTFSGFDSPPIHACRSCGSDLTASQNEAQHVQAKGEIQAVEDAYRAMLLGMAPNPALLGKATDRSFRQFVEDILQLLTRNLNLDSPWQPIRVVSFSRQDILRIVTALIENAAPTSDRRLRAKLYRRGLILWATLLEIIPQYEGRAIEQSSLHWPVALRRRFVSALYYRTKKRWPYSPYGTNVGSRIERDKIASVYRLRALPHRSQVQMCNLEVPNFVSRLTTISP